MIIDYELTDKFLPSQREVWLMSKKAEEDGHEVTRAMLKAMDSGALKYIDGKFYRLCKHCLDYLPLEDFYENKRYVMNVNYICKRCVATRRRIKQYGVAGFISDVGMKQLPTNVTFNVSDDTKKVLKERLG